MLIYPTSFWTTPFILLIAVLDAYLVLTGLFLITRALARRRTASPHWVFHTIVEAPPQAAHRRLVRWRGRAVASWVAWTVVIVTAIVVRRLLVCLVFALA